MNDDLIRMQMDGADIRNMPEGPMKDFMVAVLLSFQKDLRPFHEFLEMHKQNSNCEALKMSLLGTMIVQPERYESITGVFETLTGMLDFQKYFETRADSMIGGIWKMCAKSPTPEVAEIGAFLVAEYLRCKIVKNEKFVPDLSRGFQTDFMTQQSITDAMTRKAHKDSILMIQHALVEAVARDKDKYPLNRGIPFLNVVQEDVGEEVSRIWTKPLQDVRYGSKYDPVKGDLPPSTTMVFAP